MRNKQKQINLASSFVVENKITQLPEANQKKKTQSKGGFKVVIPPLDPYLVAKIASDSSTLRGIINSKADFISSGVLNIDDNALSKLETDLYKSYNFYELEKRVAKDRYTFGYAFILSIKNNGSYYARHIDASSVRFIDNDLEDYESVAISKDWDNNRVTPYEVALYPNYTKIENKEFSIIPIVEYDTNKQSYPLPNWIGAWYDAQVESLIGQYNANQFENGITLSSILMFDFGEVASEDLLKEKQRKLERNLQGTSGGNSGKALVVPYGGEIKPPQYTTYPMEKEGSWIELQKLVENNIVKACSWYRSLSGLESAGSLGNNQQLRNEWELAERAIRNEQYIILEATFKALNLEVKEYSFSNSSPFSLVNDMATFGDILTKYNKQEFTADQAKELLSLLGLEEEKINNLIK